jgi:hypothetical protein
MYGRPPALSKEYFDVQPLSDDDMGPENHCQKQVALSSLIGAHCFADQTWQYKWALECLAPVHVLLYADKPPLYSHVVHMGVQVEEYRTFIIPDTNMERQRPDHELRVIQSRISRAFKERLLLYLHRPFCLLGKFLEYGRVRP